MENDGSGSDQVPTKLYKYCPPERVDILLSRSVRFTPADQFNDPFEFILRVENIETEAEMRRRFSYRAFKERTHEESQKIIAEKLPPELLASGTRKQRQRTKTLLRKKFEPKLRSLVAQVSEAASDLAPDFVAATPSVIAKAARAGRDQFGILCLTEKFDNYAMWAHYGQRHSGIVLEFDMGKFGTTSGFASKGFLWTPEKVRYLADKHYDYASGEGDPNLLLAKHDDWTYEQEWRILGDLESIRSAETYRGFELVELTKGSISGIYLGADFLASGTLSTSHIEAAVDNNISIYFMERRWSEARLRAVKAGQPIYREIDPFDLLSDRVSSIAQRLGLGSSPP